MRATKDQVEAIRMLLRGSNRLTEDILFITQGVRCLKPGEFKARYYRTKEGFIKRPDRLEDLTQEEAGCWIKELQGEGVGEN